ncbi:hypothetical protein XBP1_1340065 [Xenorhabdus bovienii str. puntauvense]|uniref:Uncharacterized protein n=1 Tax=Xenorhabdus bovienii str. puntauvense TaxID=1398201 RepID=A0A077NC23_XENBV|nr:hypothetical protein XBFFR1_1760015 [Xenorhabdus bovienii str. feltiae France]CDG95520.1 hypothetical protein XBP1_1340065 [Xenorhabdus bovienii str. puntauvense]
MGSTHRGFPNLDKNREIRFGGLLYIHQLSPHISQLFDVRLCVFTAILELKMIQYNRFNRK